VRKIHHEDLIAVDEGGVGLEDQIAHEWQEFICTSARRREKKRMRKDNSKQEGEIGERQTQQVDQQ